MKEGRFRPELVMRRGKKVKGPGTKKAHGGDKRPDVGSGPVGEKVITVA